VTSSQQSLPSDNAPLLLPWNQTIAQAAAEDAYGHLNQALLGRFLLNVPFFNLIFLSSPDPFQLTDQLSDEEKMIWVQKIFSSPS
jgi:hypothetical protein